MTIAIDFDGTIAQYYGWEGKRSFRPPVAGAVEAINFLKEAGHTIIIYTCRLEVDSVSDYLIHAGIPFDYINFNPSNISQSLHPAKVVADVYIDDRSIRFEGLWDMPFISKIIESRPWWRR